MRIQRWPVLALCAALPAVAGCANVLAFSTATKFGVDISQRADQTIDVTMGYDRVEIATIPVPDDATESPDATSTADCYSVLGLFDVQYGNPWKDEPLKLSQFFATGWAAKKAAQSSDLQRFFAQKAKEIADRAAGENQP